MQTVLVIGKYYPPYFGGIEQVTKQCVESLRSDYKVVVLCYNASNTTVVETIGDLTVVRCATPFAPYRQPISFEMAFRILACRADLIHFHAPNFWGAALVVLLKPRIPLLVTHHADVEGRKLLRMLLLPLYKLILSRAVKVTVSSLKNYRLSRDLRCNNDKVVEIPFGLRPSSYERTERPDDVQDDAARLVVFGFCGRLVWYKGLEILLEAFQRVEGGALWIIGDGPLREKMEALARELGLEDRVTFHGRVSDERKIELIKAMDVFVLPSTHITETFGISQMEAQMCGVPCISSNLPTGVSDVVDPNVTGILVEPGNVEDLAQAMQRMLSEPDFRSRCGREARTRAVRLFSESTFQRRYLKLVTAIMEDGGKPSVALPQAGSRRSRLYRR